MANIHGVVWLVVGFIVFFISRQTDMVLFKYVGLFFIAIGVAKICIWYVTRHARERKESPSAPKKKHGAKKSHPAASTASAESVPKGYTHNCPECHTPMRSLNVFCHRCGRKQ